MVKCYLSGVCIPIEEAFVLDIPAAFRAVKDFREKAATIERLIEQLRPFDVVDFFDKKSKTTTTRKHKRVVNAALAAELSQAYPECFLFISWDEWLVVKKGYIERFSGGKKDD